MTLPHDTPPAVSKILAQYRHGTIDQKEMRRRIEDAAKSDPETAAFRKSNLGWVEIDDDVDFL